MLNMEINVPNKKLEKILKSEKNIKLQHIVLVVNAVENQQEEQLQEQEQQQEERLQLLQSLLLEQS